MVQVVPPVHRLSGKELQLVVIEAEAAEGEEPSESFRGQVVQGVVAKTKPLHIVQTLGQISEQFQTVGVSSMFTTTDVLIPERPCWECTLAGYGRGPTC